MSTVSEHRHGPFPVTKWVSRCQKKFSGLYGAREDNRGRHTDNLDGRHSHRTNQRPTSIMLPFLRQMPCLLQHTHDRFTAFFPEPPGVRGKGNWTLWCKGKLTEADTPTIRLGATPSGLTGACLHHPPIFLQAGFPSCCPTNSIKALKAFLLQPSQFILAWDRHQICWLTSNMLACIPSGLLSLYQSST